MILPHTLWGKYHDFHGCWSSFRCQKMHPKKLGGLAMVGHLYHLPTNKHMGFAMFGLLDHVNRADDPDVPEAAYSSSCAVESPQTSFVVNGGGSDLSDPIKGMGIRMFDSLIYMHLNL